MANISFNYDHKVSPDSFFPVWIGKTTAIINNVTVLNNDRDIQIVVSSDFDYPETFNQLNPVVIKITMSRLSYWAQAVYQYAHEYCHYLINSPLPSLRDEWFEEVICECASRYVLLNLNNDVEAQEHFKEFFKKYAINREDPLIEEKFALNSLNENSVILAELRNNHSSRNSRKYFNHIANLIMPIILTNDSFWQSIPGLAYFKNDNTFMENLNEWYKVSPEPAKPQVAKIIKLFNDN